MPFTRRELGGAVLLCSLAALLFLGPALFTGRWLSPADMLFSYPPWAAQKPAHWAGPSNPVLSDSVLQFEPWLAYAAERLHEGELPLWNPLNMLGAPFLANMQSAVFYPGNWPYLLWPDGAMLVVRAWLKLVIAALGMYILIRAGPAGLPRTGMVGASVAALAYAFGAFMVVWLLHDQSSVAAWLPWLWWATGRVLRRPAPRTVAALAAIVALQLLAGHPETAYHLALFTGLFALFQVAQLRPWRLREAAGRLGLWAGGYVAGALLAAIQLVPFAEYLGQGAAFQQRNNGDTFAPWLPFHYAWTLVSAGLYGNPVQNNWWDQGSNFNEAITYIGIVPLVLAPFALAGRDRARRGLAIFLTIVAAIAAGVVYHWPGIYDLVTALPLMRVGANQRLVVMLQFALAWLAALGVTGFQEGLPQRRRLALLLVLISGGTLLAGVGPLLLYAHSYFQLPADSPADTQIWNAALIKATVLILGSALLLALVIGLARRRPRVAGRLLGLLPLVLAADLWQTFGTYSPTVSPQNYYPATPVTTFLQAQAGQFRTAAPGWIFMPNTNLRYTLANLSGYDAITPASFQDLAGQIDPTQQAASGAGYGPFQTVQSRLINLLNVRYVLTTPDSDPNYILDVQQNQKGKQPVGEIWGSRQVGQNFVENDDSLSQIAVLGTTYGKKLSGRLIFHLRADLAAPTDLVTQTLDIATLRDNSYWTITFPPIRAAVGRRFYFFFEAPDSRPGQAVSLWYSDADVYQSGAHIENGRPAGGDLVFQSLASLSPGRVWFQRIRLSGAGVNVFENMQARPRAWLTHRVEVQADRTERIKRVAAPVFDAAQVALLDAPLPPGAALPPAPAPSSSDVVSITEYAPEAVEIRAVSAAPGVLILADQAFPGWEVQVDGQPAAILTVDHALRGVYLPAGAHQVAFVYRPASFRLGALGSGAGLLLMGALIGWPHRRRTRTG